MFICRDCNHIFEEAQYYTISGFWGSPYTERDSCCPNCHSDDYTEAKQCSECREYYIADELIGGVCESCIDSYRHDVNGCINVAREMPKEEIKINPLLAYLFDEKDIEAILIERVKERMSDVDCSPFIDNDITMFAEKITA